MMDEWLNDSEGEQDDGKPTRMTAFYIGVALLPVIFLFDHLGRFELGLNIFLCLSVNVLVVRTRRELKKYVWFWATMAVVLALEWPIVLKVKWPDRWVPAVSLLPIALAAYLFAMGAIKLVEKVMVKAPPSDENA
jgi:hypothetical protein